MHFPHFKHAFLFLACPHKQIRLNITVPSFTIKPQNSCSLQSPAAQGESCYFIRVQFCNFWFIFYPLSHKGVIPCSQTDTEWYSQVERLPRWPLSLRLNDSHDLISLWGLGGRKQLSQNGWQLREKKGTERRPKSTNWHEWVWILFQWQKTIFDPGQSLTYGDKMSIIMHSHHSMVSMECLCTTHTNGAFNIAHSIKVERENFWFALSTLVTCLHKSLRYAKKHRFCSGWLKVTQLPCKSCISVCTCIYVVWGGGLVCRCMYPETSS